MQVPFIWPVITWPLGAVQKNMHYIEIMLIAKKTVTVVHSGHFSVSFNASWLSLGDFRSCLSFSPASQQIYSAQVWFSSQWSPEPQRWKGPSPCCQNWSCQDESNHRQVLWINRAGQRLRKNPEITNPVCGGTETRNNWLIVLKSFPFRLCCILYVPQCILLRHSNGQLGFPSNSTSVSTDFPCIWKWLTVWIITTNHFNIYILVLITKCIWLM